MYSSQINVLIIMALGRFEGNLFGRLLTIWANISGTVHAMTSVCMNHIYKLYYD